MGEENFEISIQPSSRKKSTRKKSRKSKKASDNKVEVGKEKMVMPQEEWGYSIQDLHLEKISKSLNEINSNFESTNEHLSWLAFAIKIGLFLLCIQVVFALFMVLILVLVGY